jgi:hypothetical protein
MQRIAPGIRSLAIAAAAVIWMCGQGLAQTPASLPEHVTNEVQRRLDYALSLAERGAVLSARAETTDALRLIARTLDAAHPSEQRTQMLDQALDSLFSETPAGPAELHQRYHQATELLVQAVSGQPAASRALCTLGRLQTMPQSALEQNQKFSAPRAMSLHLAAVRTDPQNSEAAHELGTLFAQYEQLQQAEFWLKRCTVRTTHPESWDNLAAVLDKQGKTAEAATARARARQLETAVQASSSGDRPAVNWVDPATFAAISGSDAGNGPIELTSAKVAESRTDSKASQEAARTGWTGRICSRNRKGN